MSAPASSSPVRQIDDPIYLDHYQTCTESFRIVEEDDSFRRYPDAYYHTYDVLEFFWKALGVLFSGTYPPNHLPDESRFDSLMRQASPHISSTTASQLKQIFLRYNPRWTTRNPEGRAHSRYGNGGRTPYDLINKTTSRTALNDSREVARIHARVYRELRVSSGVIQIGLLDGRFSPADPTEKVCNISPWGDVTSDPVSEWERVLSAISGTKVTLIPVLELTNRYTIVINPFGEAYPDLTVSRTVLPGYKQILNYIGNGGVFVTAGGHPFTYYYDVVSGRKTDVKRVIPNVLRGPPISAVVQGQSRVSIPVSNVISDNLLNIDFDCETTWDVGLGGPMVTVPRQDSSDLKCGSFSLPAQLEEFRSIDPTKSGRAIPVVRGRRSDGSQVFLASLVPYGLGYLLHFGLNLGRGKMAEFGFASKGVELACRNFLNYFS